MGLYPGSCVNKLYFSILKPNGMAWLKVNKHRKSISESLCVYLWLKEKIRSITAFTQVALHQHKVFLERLFQLAFDNLPHRLTFAE